jgi:hypothetical protein
LLPSFTHHPETHESVPIVLSVPTLERKGEPGFLLQLRRTLSTPAPCPP